MRVLHTMIRVGDLQRSLQFYTEVLGMTLLRQRDYPDGKFTLAFVGYGPESEQAVIELTYNYGVERYELGVIQAYLPQQMDADELAAAVAAAIAEAGAAGPQDMGKVMAVLKPKLAGRADMGALSGLVKQALAK